MNPRFITLEDPLYPAELDLRFRVLRAPLGLPRDSVTFPFEAECLHLLALENDVVVGCVLFHPEDSSHGRLLQMAVSPSRQRAGIGRALVRTLEMELSQRGVEELHLHARAIALPFYEKLGYAVYGEPFTEVGIPHRHMRRHIGGPAAPAQ